MQLAPQKKDKKPLIRYMALFMILCYLANPLQEQISTMLHELSHGLELPSFVMDHQMVSNTDREMHLSHSHTDETLNHQHNLIDFIDIVFQASNEHDHSDDPQPVTIKWSKHLNCYEFTLPSNLEPWVIVNFSTPPSLQPQVLFDKLGRPPIKA